MQFRDGSATRTADSQRAAQLARQTAYSEAVAADRPECHCQYPKLPASQWGRDDEFVGRTCLSCGGEFAL